MRPSRGCWQATLDFEAISGFAPRLSFCAQAGRPRWPKAAAPCSEMGPQRSPRLPASGPSLASLPLTNEKR